MEEGRPLLGNDQDVTAAEGPDVEEGEHVLVLVHPVARDLAGDDLVEHGLSLCHGLASRPGCPSLRHRLVDPF